MTIRMLQAWNGLHQQKIVTTLSGSDEAALVAAGIASYDLDGPADNVRMAQLATDAGGRLAGLSDPVDGGLIKLARVGKTAVIFGDSITAQNHSPAAITSLTRTNGVVTAVATNHGMFTGTSARVYGAADGIFDGFGGVHQITRVDANTFTYPQADLADDTAGACTFINLQKQDDRGWFFYANSQLGLPFQIVGNAGVAGETTASMLLRIDRDVLAHEPDVCFVLAGVNDISGGVPAATIISNLQSIYQQLAAKLITVVALTITPYGSGHASYNTANVQTMLAVNKWIRQYCAATPGMICVDTFAALVNPAGSGAAASGVLYDNLHPAPKGALAMGTAVKNVLTGRFPAGQYLVSSNSDNYGADAGNSNIWDNAPWTTTGGTVNAPATGTAATGHVIDATGSLTAVASVPARADGIGYNQRLVLTPAANNDSGKIRWAGNLLNSRLVAGTWRLSFDLSIAGVAAANVKYINIYLSATIGGTNLNLATLCNASSNGTPGADIVGPQYIDFVVPSGAVTACSLNVEAVFSGAGSALTIDVGRDSLERIS